MIFELRTINNLDELKKLIYRTRDVFNKQANQPRDYPTQKLYAFVKKKYNGGVRLANAYLCCLCFFLDRLENPPMVDDGSVPPLGIWLPQKQAARVRLDAETDALEYFYEYKYRRNGNGETTKSS